MDSSILANECLQYVKERALNVRIFVLVFTLRKSILIYFGARFRLGQELHFQ